MTTKRKGKKRKEEIHNKCDQKYFSLIRHHEKHVTLLALEFVCKHGELNQDLMIGLITFGLSGSDTNKFSSLDCVCLDEALRITVYSQDQALDIGQSGIQNRVLKIKQSLSRCIVGISGLGTAYWVTG